MPKKPGEQAVMPMIDRLSPIGKWLLGAVFLAAPLTTLRPIGSVTIGDVFLALAFGLALVLLPLRGRLPPVPRLVWIGCAVLLASVLITVIWPPESVVDLVESFGGSNYDSTLTAGLRLVIALIALPVAVALIVDRWSTINFLINAWIIGVTASCLVAVIDACTGSNLQETFTDNPELLSIFQNGVPPRFMGLAVHPTSFSITAVMVLPLVLAKILSPRTALIYAPMILILIFAVVLSGSRVGILGLVVIAGLYICLSSNLRRVIFRSGLPTLALATGVVLAGVLLFVLGPPVDPADDDWYETIPVKQGPSAPPSGATEQPVRPGKTPQAPPNDRSSVIVRPDTDSASRFDPSVLGSDTSSKERLKRFEDSLDYIQERPFAGYGFEWIESSHSIYLQLLVSGGVLALIGFLVAMWGYAKAWLFARRKVPDAYREVLLGLGVSTVAFLLMGLAQTDLLDRYVYLPVALILSAYAMLLAGQNESTDEDEIARSA